jgi:hypothetical protein
MRFEHCFSLRIKNNTVKARGIEFSKKLCPLFISFDLELKNSERSEVFTF